MNSLSESSRPSTLLPCSICNKISFNCSRHPPPLPQCSCRTKGARPKSRSATPNNPRLIMLKKARENMDKHQASRATRCDHNAHAACARSRCHTFFHLQPLPPPPPCPPHQYATSPPRGGGTGGPPKRKKKQTPPSRFLLETKNLPPPPQEKNVPQGGGRDQSWAGGEEVFTQSSRGRCAYRF